MRQLFVILVIFLSAQTLQAQNTTITVRSEKTGKQEVIDVPESLQNDMDKNYQDWQSKTFINLDADCELTSTNPIVSDEVIIDRLSRIPSVIEMPFNEAIINSSTCTPQTYERKSLLCWLLPISTTRSLKKH